MGYLPLQTIDRDTEPTALLHFEHVASDEALAWLTQIAVTEQGPPPTRVPPGAIRLDDYSSTTAVDLRHALMQSQISEPLTRRGTSTPTADGAGGLASS